MKKLMLVLLSSLVSIVFASDNVLFLDGDGDFVHFDHPVINTETFTIEGWTFMQDKGGAQYHQSPIYIQRTGKSSGTRTVAGLWAENHTNQMVCSLLPPDGTNELYYYPKASYKTWHHYAVVVAAYRVQLYLDGIKILDDPREQYTKYNTLIDHSAIGKHIFNSTPIGYFNGMMNNLRIWNKALSESELLTAMADTLNLKDYAENNDLAACWRFDTIEQRLDQSNTAVNVIPDLSGNNNHGYLMGDATIIEYTAYLGVNTVKIDSVFYNNKALTSVPVNIKYSTSIHNLSLIISYNQNQLELTDIDLDSTLVNVKETTLDYSEQDNHLLISVASSENFKTVGTLLNLKFTVKDTTVQFIPINLTGAESGGQTTPPVLISGGIIIPIQGAGDVDRNGSIDINDVDIILEHIAEKVSIPANHLHYADTNDDGLITALDASIILQFLSGDISTLPVSTNDAYKYAYSGDLVVNAPYQDQYTVKIPLIMDNLSPLYSVDCEILYNPDNWYFNNIYFTQDVDNYIVNQTDNNKISWHLALAEPLSGTKLLGYLEFTAITNNSVSTGMFFINKLDINAKSIVNTIQDIAMNALPNQFTIKQNYPNPFNSQTQISYSISKPAHIKIDIYNIQGQKIKSLINSFQFAGDHQVKWVGKDDFGHSVASGVYFTRIKVGNQTDIIKMLYAK